MMKATRPMSAGAERSHAVLDTPLRWAFATVAVATVWVVMPRLLSWMPADGG
jgi:hypothetical protein